MVRGDRGSDPEYRRRDPAEIGADLQSRFRKIALTLYLRERAPYGEGFIVAKALQQMAAQATDSAPRAFHNEIP